MHSGYGSAVARALNARYYEIETARAKLPGHEKDPVDVLALAWRTWIEGTRRKNWNTRAVNSSSPLTPTPVRLRHPPAWPWRISRSSIACAAPRPAKSSIAETLQACAGPGTGHPQSLVAWGDILFLRQRPEDALRVWRKALEIRPDYQIAPSYGERAHQAGPSGGCPGASWTRHRPAPQPDASAAMAASNPCRRFVLARHDDEAYEILRSWTAEFPNNGSPYLMMAAIDVLHGRSADAAANMARHRQMLPLSTVSYVVLTYPSTDPGFLSQRERLVRAAQGRPTGGRQMTRKNIETVFIALLAGTL